MKTDFSIFKYILFSCLSIFLFSCEETDENVPLDIINGEVDIVTLHAQRTFSNPVQLSGRLTSKETGQQISSGSIVALRVSTNQKYTTQTKYDGSFSLYVEGEEDYQLYAEKEGFDRVYYFRDDNTDDTTITINSYTSSIYFKIPVHDPTPKFQVKYLFTKNTTNSITDINYTGTNLEGVSYYYHYNYDSDGNPISERYFTYMDKFFTSLDTLYYNVSESSRYIGIVGKKSGNGYGSIYAQIPSSTLKGIHAFDNYLWLLTSNTIYKINTNGELIKTISLSGKIAKANLIGIANRNTDLYVLQSNYDYNSYSETYVLYKINPETGEVMSKGNLPYQFNDNTLNGLACDGTNFWTIGNSSYYNNTLMKFSTVE